MLYAYNCSRCWTKNSNNTENTSESLTTPLETNSTVPAFECVSNLQKNADVYYT